MPRAAAARAGDLTGQKKAELAEKAAKEQEAAAASLAMATAAAAEKAATEPIDLEPSKAPVEEKVVDDVAVATSVDVKEEIVKFRVSEDLEQVTIGAGNHYDFKQGQEYRAPKFIYDHLEEKGLIWH